MKNSVKPLSTKGYSKARKRRERKRMANKFPGPLTVKEVLRGTKEADKHDVDMRSFTVRTVPADPNSMTFTRGFKVLNQPKRPIEVLRIKKLAEDGIFGNHLTTGVQRYAFWRSLLDGTAVASFEKHTHDTGNETNDNLKTVVNKWLADLLPQKILSNHQEYLRNQLEKPFDLPTKRFFSIVEELNGYNKELPPNFDADQKIKDGELCEHIVKALPKEQREILRTNGIEPRTATNEQIISNAERVEDNDYVYYDWDSESKASDDEKPKQNSSKKKGSSKQKASKKQQHDEFWCELHGKNPTRNTEQCRQLKSQEHKKWKKEDCKAHKKAKEDLHLLEVKLAETKKKLKASNVARDREQKKFNEYMKKSKAEREAMHHALSNSSDRDSDDSEARDSSLAMKRIPRKKRPRQESSDNDSSVGSKGGSGSDSDDAWKASCKSEVFVYNKTTKEMCQSEPFLECNSLDEAVEQSFILSDL